MKFYSPTTRGFYDDLVHGSRQIDIVDPQYVPPEVTDPDEPLPEPPYITVDNPFCRLPDDAQEISDERYHELLDEQTAGKNIVPGTDGLPIAIAPPAPDLTAVKRGAIRDLETAAEKARQNFLSPGMGQAMVYLRKVQEAETMQLDESPAAEDYPLLAVEVGLTASTLQEVAAVILLTRDYWLGVAANIEQVRLTAKYAITAAETIEAIQAVMAGITWPQPAEDA